MTGGANTSTFEFTRDGMPTQDTPCLTVNDACVAILLTTAVNRTTRSAKEVKKGLTDAAERLVWYERSLRLWEADVYQRHAIVVVDNSVGALLRAAERYPHLETINFNHTRQEERRHCGHKASAMGEQELVSIGHAMRTSSRINNPRTTHILKITGRYYAPGLAEHLKGLTRVHALIRQGSTSGVGCEALGCKLGPPGLQPSLPRGFCSYAFRCPYAKDGNCEATQRYRFRLTNPLLRKANNYSIYTLPNLPVAFTQTGTNAFSRDTIRSFPEGSGKKKKKKSGR